MIKKHFGPLRTLTGDGDLVARAKTWASERSHKILCELSVHLSHTHGFYSRLRSPDPDDFTLQRVVVAIESTQSGGGGLTACSEDIMSKAFWIVCDPELRYELIWGTGDSACLKVTDR